MKSQVNSKTVKICEKQTPTNLLKDDSVCSCVKCDSYRCFALRNKTRCSCENCPRLDKTITENITSKMDVHNIESFIKEHFKAEINYDNINENLQKESIESYTRPRKNFTSDIAKLSAQIMNLPYSDFKESISFNRFGTGRRNTKLNKLDIFRRIREAYKACSCKVCECIIGRADTYNNFCKCKPCECADCVAVMNNLRLKGKYQRSGESHLQCKGKYCKGLVKKCLSEPQSCDCDPCDCLTCFNSLNEPCKCKPCECIDCKAFSMGKPKTLIVSRVEEDLPRNCSCSPCDCAECTQNTPMASNLRHEVSTGMSRPANCNCDNCITLSCEESDNDRCSCEIQKQIMSKPFQKDIRDYDVHRASVNNFSFEEKPNVNTIAMFAAVENTSPTYNLVHMDCNCDGCECLVCSHKEQNATLIKNSKLFLMAQNENSCKCLPCECEVCKVGNVQSPVRIPKPCTCDICDCLKCEGFVNVSPIRHGEDYINIPEKLSTNQCKCMPCECTICRPFAHNCIQNQYHHTFSQSAIYSNSEKRMNQDKRLIYTRLGNYFNKIKTYAMPKKSITTYDTDKPSSSNFLNKERNDTPGKIMFTKKQDYENSSKSVHELNKTSLICDMYKQCTEKYVSHFDKKFPHSDLDISDSITSSDSKYNRHSDEFVVSVQEDATKPLIQNNVISSYTTRRLLSSAVDGCINDIAKINTNVELNGTKKYDNHGNHIENIQDNNIQRSRKYSENLTAGSIPSQVNSEQRNNVNKIGVDEPQINHKRTVNVKKISEDLVHFLKDANDKISNSKCADLCNELRTETCNKNQIYKRTVPSSDVKSKDFMNDGIDFAKVKSSLQQAKTFSMELIKLLKYYESVNKDFHELTNLGYSMTNVAYENKLRERRDTNCSPLKKLLADNSTLQTYNIDGEFEKINNHNISKTKAMKSTIDYGIPTTSNNKELIHYLLSPNNTKLFKSTGDNTHITHQQYNTNVLSDINDTFEPRETFGANRASDTGKVFEKQPGFERTEFSETFNSTNIANDESLKSRQLLTTSTSTFTLDESQKQLKLQDINGVQGGKTWSVLKKNTDVFGASFTKNKGFYHMVPTLTLEAKTVLKPNPDQCNRHEYNAPKEQSLSYCDNKPLVSKKQETHHSNHDILTDIFDDLMPHKDISSSCESLKVKVLGLRRISHHTILVKWKAPRDLTNVEGYELLIDGRAIQTILSPHRRMAVVSCLPNLDHMLITIRTIVTSGQYRDHHPSANIVYRPRNH